MFPCYTWKERERERYIYIYVYTPIYVLYVYIYIHRERERERERAKGSLLMENAGIFDCKSGKFGGQVRYVEMYTG